MAEFTATRNPNRCPTHPGELLRDVILPAIDLGKSELAGKLGISRQHLYDILNERKPVSPEVAVRLGKAFGDGADVWLRMQSAFDAWHAERTVDVSRVPSIIATKNVARHISGHAAVNKRGKIGTPVHTESGHGTAFSPGSQAKAKPARRA